RYCVSYSLNLGSRSIIRTELSGVVLGLHIVWKRGYRRVHVELDSQVAVQLLLLGLLRSPVFVRCWIGIGCVYLIFWH
ncbi:hypothetical protein LINPERHAP1_LOCUS42094, partial [Linum perenne]